MSSFIIPNFISAVISAFLKNNKARVKSLFLLLVVTFVISGCTQGNSTVSAGNNDGGIVVPVALLNLPQGGSLTGYIKVDDGDRQQMTINEGNASISLTGITEGSHTFTVEFEYIYTDPVNNFTSNPILVASVSKTMNVVQGNNSLNILESDYDTTSFDEDGDGESNLEEISAGSNPFASILVSLISGNTNEGGATATFSVNLTSFPADDVTIAINSSDPSEGQADQASITFTPNNWLDPQIVTITGIDDNIADGDITYIIQLDTAISNDPNYSGIDPNDVVVVNTDNDSAGFTVSPISGNTTESGVAATFTVVLNSAPTADVSIEVSSSNILEGIVDTGLLMFGASNWNDPQIITVTGIDDLIADGNQVYSVQFTAVVSTDSHYSGLILPDVMVTNVDNDSPGFNVSPISGNTSEDGMAASFTVVLTSAPTADVTVGINSSNVNEGTADVTSITFTPGNWNNIQTVTVTGIDDSVIDGDQVYTIELGQATSSDSNYAGLNPVDVNVTNIDNDGVTPPTVSNGEISISALNGTGMTLSWNKANDSFYSVQELQYRVYYAKTNVLTSIANTEALGTLALDWTNDIDVIEASNLEGLTDYHLNIIVRNPAGLKALYSSATEKTYAAGIPNLNFNNSGQIEYVNQDGVDQYIRAMIKDNQGNFILVGSTSGTSSDVILMKVSPAGVLMFNTVHDDLGNETASDVTVDANNNIYVSGAKDQLMTVWRFDSQGNIDTSFGTDGRISHPGGVGQGNDDGSVVMIDNQNKIVVVGNSWNNGDYDIFVWRFTSSGVLDTASFAVPNGFFSIDGPVSGNGWDLAASAIIDDNNRIIVGGFFDSGLLDNGSTDVDGVVLVLNSSGVPDSQFGGGTGYVILNEGVVSSDRVLDLAIDSNGFILGVGQTGLAGKTDMIIWSLDPVTGALNPGFNAGQGWLSHDGAGGLIDFEDRGSGVTIDPRSNNILIAGSTFAFVEVTPFLNQMTIWRLKPDGTLDTSFDNDGFATYFSSTQADGDGVGNSVLIGADETIYVGGYTYGGGNTDADFAIWNYK